MGYCLKKKRQQKCLTPIKLRTGFMVRETEVGQIIRVKTKMQNSFLHCIIIPS